MRQRFSLSLITIPMYRQYTIILILYLLKRNDVLSRKKNGNVAENRTAGVEAYIT